jgi:hypothetical protein
MSGDKRSVATDALEVLGNIITDKDVGRDAIHLACEPVIAGVPLFPGQHIGRLKDGRYGPAAEKLVGIVDPFLTHQVLIDQKFLLVVYPRTITSLRHVWSHPDFVEDVDQREEAAKKYYNRDEKEAALERLFVAANDFGETLDPVVSAQNVVDAMDYGYITVYGTDAYGKIDIPTELWYLYRAAYGRTAAYDPSNTDDGVYFSCSC